MITMPSYVLFSQEAFDFPIHTLGLLRSLVLASQLTLCAPFASVLSGFSTNSPFSVSLPFFRPSDHVSRNTRGQGHAGLFHETTHLKRPNDTSMYPMMQRLLQLWPIPQAFWPRYYVYPYFSTKCFFFQSGFKFHFHATYFGIRSVNESICVHLRKFLV